MFVFVCRCNGEVDLGSKALDDVLYRAQLELFPEPLLVGGIMFLCAAVTPPSSHVGLWPNEIHIVLLLVCECACVCVCVRAGAVM